MNNRQYYYLVAGLPDIVLDQPKMPFSVAAFREELKAQLHPDDYRLVEWLFLPADNRNLLHFLLKTEATWDDNCHYSPDDFADALREPERLHVYMQTFIAAFQAQEPLRPGMTWENQLTELFYDYALANTQGFLNDWFLFDRNLRNVLAAMSIRRNRLSAEGQLIGEYEFTAALRNSHARDFGLSGEFPMMERLLQWEDNNWLEREMAIDAKRWKHLDDLNAFNYFSVEVLLAYLIKLMILQRWAPLDKADGETVFKNIIGHLEHSVPI